MKPLQEVMKKEKLVVMLLIGLLMLIIALPVKKGDDQEYTEDRAAEEAGEEGVFRKDWQTRMEERLRTVLEQVEGVGKTEIFLTCESTERKIVEKDQTDTVFEKDAKGNQSPYVASEEYPKVVGVLVVAQGGDDPVIIQNIQEAVVALFQVDAHKIKVMKMN